MVFASPSDDLAILARNVRPRTLVCILVPSGAPTPDRDSLPFHRYLLLTFRTPKCIEVHIDHETREDDFAALAGWLKPFDITLITKTMPELTEYTETVAKPTIPTWKERVLRGFRRHVLASGRSTRS
jgi:hypothetical protein